MRRRLGWVSLALLLVLLAITGAVTWATRTGVDHQESKLLDERANEVNLVLSTATNSLEAQLNTIGGLLRRTHNSQQAFKEATDSTVTSSEGTITIAVLRQTSSGYAVIMANGDSLQRGQMITDQRATAIARASTTPSMVATEVMGTGADRVIGFAIGPPVAPPGLAVYQQTNLGKLGPPQAANTAPFSEVDTVLYDGSSPDQAEAVVSSAKRLPLTGQIARKMLPVGDQNWLLEVRAVHPLVGSTTYNAPWFVAAAGVLLSILITLVAEIESRRRRHAVALYRNEHRVAEELQRSLLPDLPSVAGLELSARYLAGTEGMQVGGDWYDVFSLGEDRFGVVIGDVVGHDISASATMSRAQAALRAYAFRETDPGAVLDRLDSLIDTFPSDRMVTVFYGVIEPADPSGIRTLWYANAGHPPPIVCLSDGGVTELDAASSLLLGVGADSTRPRPSARADLALDSTLVLFTDGLVEVPGESLTISIERLKALVGGCCSLSPEEMVDRITAGTSDNDRRDDVALIAIQLGAPDVPADPSEHSRGAERTV